MLKHPKNQTAADGLRLQQAAEQKRRVAEHLAASDPAGALWARRDADVAERKADAILALPDKPDVGTGGELQLSEADAFELPGLVSTVESPDLVNAEASRDRLELAGDAHCLAMAADTAQTIQAQNSLEKMLAHQLAAAHTAAMKLMARAHLEIGNLNEPFNPGGDTMEAARLSNAAARLMDTYQRGLQSLQKLRCAAPASKPSSFNTCMSPTAGRRWSPATSTTAGMAIGVVEKNREQPYVPDWRAALQAANAVPRCGARTTIGSPCRGPAMPNGRCRLHGGKSPGAPKGNRNAWKHGRYSAEALAETRDARRIMRTLEELIATADRDPSQG